MPEVATPEPCADCLGLAGRPGWGLVRAVRGR